MFRMESEVLRLELEVFNTVSEDKSELDFKAVRD